MRTYDPADLIIAVASPPGRSVRGLIRLSGSGSFELLDAVRLCSTSSSESLPRSRGLSSERLTLFDHPLPALVLRFPGPRSYTGEDVIELLLPGLPVLLDRVIDALLTRASESGLSARRAEAGEFTARAYFNHRLSLTEAEGVAAAIAARSDAELRAADQLISGRLGGLALDLADRLATALALVEAGIDFTDQDDVIAITPDDLLARLSGLEADIARHLERAIGFADLRALPAVVFIGPPNAGKSTLFNALLGRERAVVSDQPGTTRDALREPLTLTTPGTPAGTAEIMLIDIAGLDDDPTGLNPHMQATAERTIEEAEVLLVCLPADTHDAPQLSALRHDPRLLLVHTKSDLAASSTDTFAATADSGPLRVSATTGAGLETLREALAGRLADRTVSLAADALALQPRHEAALRSALGHLQEAIDLLSASDPETIGLEHPELLAASMRSSLDELAALAGQITPDDVLGRVFMTFCIGK